MFKDLSGPLVDPHVTSSPLNVRNFVVMVPVVYGPMWLKVLEMEVAKLRRLPFHAYSPVLSPTVLSVGNFLNLLQTPPFSIPFDIIG